MWSSGGRLCARRSASYRACGGLWTRRLVTAVQRQRRITRHCTQPGPRADVAYLLRCRGSVVVMECTTASYDDRAPGSDSPEADPDRDYERLAV